MKTLLLSALLFSLAGAGVARADGVTAERAAAPKAETRTIEIVGLQGRTTIVISDQRGDVPVPQAPYALQGAPSDAPAMPAGQGYQAR